MAVTFRNIDPQGALHHPILGDVEAEALVDVEDPALIEKMLEQPGVWLYEGGATPESAPEIGA